jgi:acyl-CoA hydrolase
VGELVEVRSRVVHVGRSSMSVIADVFAEDIANGARRHTNECWLTFVHLDEEGRPTAVPRLILETPDDERMNELAQHRRESLLAEKR